MMNLKRNSNITIIIITTFLLSSVVNTGLSIKIDHDSVIRVNLVIWKSLYPDGNLLQEPEAITTPFTCLDIHFLSQNCAFNYKA